MQIVAQKELLPSGFFVSPRSANEGDEFIGRQRADYRVPSVST